VRRGEDFGAGPPESGLYVKSGFSRASIVESGFSRTS
jgi:hypothetical protein